MHRCSRYGFLCVEWDATHVDLVHDSTMGKVCVSCVSLGSAGILSWDTVNHIDLVRGKENGESQIQGMLWNLLVENRFRVRHQKIFPTRDRATGRNMPKMWACRMACMGTKQATSVMHEIQQWAGVAALRQDHYRWGHDLRRREEVGVKSWECRFVCRHFDSISEHRHKAHEIFRGQRRDGSEH